MAVKGKWAQGIEPRNFAWVMKDRLAVCERPGGYGANHRRVRRQEEIIWVREQGFTCVVSIIPSPHNLHNYDELGVSWIHRPFGPHDEPRTHARPACTRSCGTCSAAGGKVLVHGEELGDRISGIVAGYLVWSGLVPSGPEATSLTERLLHRQIGPVGRELVAVAVSMAADELTSIELRGLRAAGICGALPEEQERAQPLEVDLDVVADLAAAGTSDALERHRRLRRALPPGRRGRQRRAGSGCSNAWPTRLPRSCSTTIAASRR